MLIAKGTNCHPERSGQAVATYILQKMMIQLASRNDDIRVTRDDDMRVT